MTEGQIKCFMAVVEKKSFSKAAAKLYVSQPSVSKTISTLEDTMEMKLIERHGSALTPTPAGKVLYHYLENAINEYKVAFEKMRNLNESPYENIRIGCPETWNPGCFFPRIKELLMKEYPDITLELISGRLPTLFSDLQAGKLDMLITHEFYPQIPYGFSVKKLTETGCGILFAKEFYGDMKDFSRLDGESFLVYDTEIEKKFTEKMRHICAKNGINPVIQNYGDFSTALFYMSCGQGFMFFSDWDIPVTNQAYSYLPLDYKSTVNLVFPTTSQNETLKNAVRILYEEFN